MTDGEAGGSRRGGKAELLAAAIALAAALPAKAETPDTIARRYDLAGELLVAKGGRALLDRGYGTIAPGGGATHRAGERWRLASITKQVTGTLVLGGIPATGWPASLDEPVGISAGGRTAAALTARMLLTHHSGLANPDESGSDKVAVPAFYRSPTPNLDYCLAKQAVPNAPFAYNNCDYILLSAVAAENGWREPGHWPPGMAMAKPGETGVPGFVGGKPEPRIELASFGAAGGLMGTARAVFDFDRGLMSGRILPPARRAALWRPEGGGSAQALGQWVFSAPLKGCAAPKRIVQRDGEIEGVQARNFILPDDDLVVIVFTNRSADDFAIGEIWQQQGFAYDLVSAAACG